jgi:hypothetical protein
MCFMVQATAGGEKFFKIYRWDPDVEGQKPYMATYPVNTKEYVLTVALFPARHACLRWFQRHVVLVLEGCPMVQRVC